MSDLDMLRTACSAELHGKAEPDDLEVLHADPDGWRDMLHDLIDDVGRQIARNTTALDARAAVETAPAMGEARRRHAEWLRTAVGFRTRCERRLATLEHETAVRRRRRLDQAHHRLAVAVYELLHADDGDTDIDTGLDALARAYADVEDAASGYGPRVLVGADT